MYLIFWSGIDELLWCEIGACNWVVSNQGAVYVFEQDKKKFQLNGMINEKSQLRARLY